MGSEFAGQHLLLACDEHQPDHNTKVTGVHLDMEQCSAV